jgi:hypothetical protein
MPSSPPGAAVQDLVVNYWCFTVRALPWPAFRHLVWSDGCVNVSVALADGHPVATPLLGPRRKPLPVDVTPPRPAAGASAHCPPS